MQPNQNNKLHIVVTTTADDLEDDFTIHQPIHVVKQRAVLLVGSGGESANFRLEFNGQILEDESRTVGEYAAQFGWVSGETVHLELVPAPEVI
jgi:hypothetical protein